MEEAFDSFYAPLENFMFDTTAWTYIAIAMITVIVLFYGTQYVLTGVDPTTAPDDNIPYKRCDVGSQAAVVSMKGHRQYMEDTYQAVPSFGGRDKWSFYGVFDGHGGARCSVYVAHFLYKHVWSCIDLYLEHYSLNSDNLWNLLLNDENLVTISKDTNISDNDQKLDKSSQIEKTHKTSENTNSNKSNTNGNNVSENEKEKENENENEIENGEIDDAKSKVAESDDIQNDSNASRNRPNLTSEAIEKLEEMDKGVKSDENKSMSVISQRGSDVPDDQTDNDTRASASTLTGDKINTAQNKEVKKLIGIPTYVQNIMKEALIQSHRYADKEFLAMANRQQWQDGSTAVSCVILPAKDILRALMNDERNGLNKSGTKDKIENSELYSSHMKNINSISVNGTGMNKSRNAKMSNKSNKSSMTRNGNSNLTIDDICDDNDTWLFVANTGDSRGILVLQNGDVVPLSSDHKPNRLDERQRIEQKGGRVVFFGVWRVEGVLAVSRAFGDRRLKRWVIPDPEIVSRKVEPNDLFLILASDGVWDAVSNEQAARYAYQVWNDPIYTNADLKTKLQAIAGKISSMAFRHGSMDNITALVVHIPTHTTVSSEDVSGASKGTLTAGITPGAPGIHRTPDTANALGTAAAQGAQ